MDYGDIIVLDCGSGVIKVGFAGEDAPRSVFPCLVGTPKRINWMIGCGAQDVYVGDEAQSHRGVLQLNQPVKSGIVTNWDDMTTVWHHAFFNELCCNPEEHPIHLTEAPMNPKLNREKMTEIMFETFRIPAVYISMQAVLSLYSMGRTTGLVLDSGDGVTHTVPIFEGYHIPNAVVRVDLAGKTLTEHLKTLLAESGYYFNTSAEVEIVRCIKEKLCFISQNYMKDISAPGSETAKKYVLPDGQMITIDSARFRCPEILFSPKLGGRDCLGVHEAIQATVDACDMDLRRMLYWNIIVAGGTTMFDGFVSRLHSEMKDLVKSTNAKIRILAPETRQLVVWIGGSILASLPSFRNICLHKEEYEERGVQQIHEKCPSNYMS